jgi:hypothetical protein
VRQSRKNALPVFVSLPISVRHFAGMLKKIQHLLSGHPLKRDIFLNLPVLKKLTDEKSS